MIEPTVVPALAIVAGLAAAGTVLVALIGVVRKPEPEKYRQLWIKMGLQLLFMAVFIGAAALGTYVIAAVLVFLAFRAWYELVRALEGKYGPILRRGLPIVLGASVPLSGMTGSVATVFLAAFGATWLSLAVPMLIERKPPPLHGMGFSAFAMAFISIPLGLLLILGDEMYDSYTFLILILMAHDGFAEGFGRLLGKRALWPDISPGKTLGGTLGGIGVCLVMGYLLRFLVPTWTVPQVLGVAAGIVVMAAIGDLVASSIKRETGIKDFGKLIPAHGGVLDRVDSLLFTTPVFFAAVSWLGGHPR